MGIYSVLSDKKDLRAGGDECLFNGFLEDYLETLENGETKDLFQSLFEMDNDAKILVNFSFGVNKKSISNSIIRYKDIFKLENKALTIPYVIYTKREDKEKALILDTEEHMYAKALYYSLTESGSAFQDYKNDCVACVMKPEMVLNAYSELMTRNAGQIQRYIDRKAIGDYDQSYAHAMEISNELQKDIDAKAEAFGDKEAYVKNCVSKWFMLKKYVYVQYMIDKNILAQRHENNIKLQRAKAKENADNIRFVSISEMWNTNKH